MIIGFTGTQAGMNQFQKDEVVKLFNAHQPRELHHGDCIGADSQCHYLFLNWHIDNDTVSRKIIIHPPLNFSKRAFTADFTKYSHGLKEKLANCKYKIVIETLDEKAYLERNRDIVDAVQVMIATPKEIDHTLRSGTWSTIRYSWHQRKETIVIPPLSKENVK